MTSASPPLDADTAFTLLSNGRRRRLLEELRRTGTTTLHDVARRVAAAERGTAPEEVGTQARKSVHVSLYQTHVPRLAEEGVVRYDAEAKTVSLVRCPATRRLLRMLDDHDDRPTDRYYAAAALAGVALVAATAVVDGGETAWRVVAGALGATAAGVALADGRDRLDAGEGAGSAPFRRGEPRRGADGREAPTADRTTPPEADRPTSDGGGGPPGQ